MKVIAFLASKGGVGKTTLAASMAVAAAQDDEIVGLFDYDEQGTITQWWMRRPAESADPDAPTNPELFQHSGLDDIEANIEVVAASGCTLLVIDSGPGSLDTVSLIASVADFVVIPTQLSLLDVEAVDDAATIVKQHRKPFAFAVNRFEPKAAASNEVALDALATRGRVLSSKIRNSPAHVGATNVGQVALENDRTARTELRALWAELKGLIDDDAERPTLRRPVKLKAR